MYVMANEICRVPIAPPALSDIADTLAKASGTGDYQAEREIRGGLGQYVWCVANSDTTVPTRGKVDVVHADGHLGDDPQIRSMA